MADKELIRSLPPELRPAAEQLPTRSKQMLVAIQQSHHSGPLPPPQMLAEYDAVVPGLAERIVVQAETQTSHRIALEKEVIGGDLNRSWCGLILGFIVCMTLIIGSLYVVATADEAWKAYAGSGIATGTVVSLVTAFIYGTRSRREERDGRKK